MVIQRLIALIIITIPGVVAAFGWKFMRDAIFNYVGTEQTFLWGSFILGLIMFIAGLGFLAGFIFYRDKKRHLVQPGLFKRKKKRIAKKNDH